MNRWIVYQRERFPLGAHAPLVAAFSTSAVCFSSLARGHFAVPHASSLLVAFATSLLFFLQLRIADEIKDADDDARFRPYRPVPRGLVSLAELKAIGFAAAAVQLGLALWLEPTLAWLLLLPWIWALMMTREFFVPRWLRAHPIFYMTSHMVVLPLIDLYATACDWRVAGEVSAPTGLFWFLTVSYLNGIVVEIGRKTRAPIDEEYGVETYSALWGARRAANVWLLAVVMTAAAAWIAATSIGTEYSASVMLAVLVAVCGGVALKFANDTRQGAGKAIEVMAGVWTLVMYVGLGAAPLAMTLLREVR
jgi:4-hydroxybenzoate polyprenyltransferase